MVSVLGLTIWSSRCSSADVWNNFSFGYEQPRPNGRDHGYARYWVFRWVNHLWCDLHDCDFHRLFSAIHHRRHTAGTKAIVLNKQFALRSIYFVPFATSMQRHLASNWFFGGTVRANTTSRQLSTNMMQENPYQPSIQSNPISPPPHLAHLVQKARFAQPLLICGLGLVPIATGLLPFVMSGLLIACPSILLAIALTIAAVLHAQTFDPKHLWIRCASFVVFLAAFFCLIGVSATATIAAQGYARSMNARVIQDPLIGRLFDDFGSSAVVAIILAIALRFLTLWPRKNCVGFGIAALSTMPIAVVCFYLFKALGLPLTA
jgi:hypothetical protein